MNGLNLTGMFSDLHFFIIDSRSSAPSNAFSRKKSRFFSRSLKRVRIWFDEVYFFRFSLTSSSPSLSSLSSSRIMSSGFWIWTDWIIDVRSFLLLITISAWMFRAFRMSVINERHSKSEFWFDEPMMSASHWMNCLNLF